MNTSLKWRDRPQPKDMEAIRTLVTRTGVFSREEVKVAVELVQDRLQRSLNSDYHFVFAEQNGALAGYTCYGRIPFTEQRYDLYWIATDPDCQKRGIASQLLRITEEAVRGLEGRKIYAETSSRSVYSPAHAFYQASGFALEATLRDYYKDGDSKMTFVKTLG